MRFGLKMLLAGIVCSIAGIWWIIDGLSDGPMNQNLGGMWWKGPLLLVGGIGAFVMGMRILGEYQAKRENETGKTEEPRVK